MPSATAALYAPLIERDLEAIPAAAREFARSHSPEELWTAVARFAVLAYAPSQHSKRAFIACRAAHDLRHDLDDRWLDLLVECARYAAESRQPWSEPPLLDPPHVDSSRIWGTDALERAIDASDRAAAEQWLAARLDDPDDDLRAFARGDALLVLDSALAMRPLVGEKGRYALLRVVIWELLSEESSDAADAPLETLVETAIEREGSIDTVRAVFIHLAGQRTHPAEDRLVRVPLEPYHLARDYAQTLIAHAFAKRFPSHVEPEPFLAAVHRNLKDGESFADWSFA